MKNTARNKQIVFFAESRKTVKFKLFLEKAKKGHSGEFLDMKEIKDQYIFCLKICIKNRFELSVIKNQDVKFKYHKMVSSDFLASNFLYIK